MKQLTLAVASDVHASPTAGQDTYIIASDRAERRTRHPIVDLVDWIDDRGISVDYLVAPGDLANQANPEGLRYAWRKLHSLASQLGAELLAVPGNHDVITHEFALDPRSELKTLIPAFPLPGDPAFSTQFWQQGWGVLENDDHRILLVDSTFDFPPFPKAGKLDADWDEYRTRISRGGFTHAQQEGLVDYLRGCSPKLNVALVHHHPIEHQLPQFMQDTYGGMRRGGDLIDSLCRFPRAGRWLVIHGHKHVPQLVHQTSTTSNGPVVLCAASLGGQLWPPLNTVTRNQFHIVTVQFDPAHSVSSLAGDVSSIMWCAGYGWLDPPQVGAGLPPRAGFGSTVDFRIVANRCRVTLEGSGEAAMRYDELIISVPELRYMPPGDFDLLEDELELSDLVFARDRHGVIREVARKAGSA